MAINKKSDSPKSLNNKGECGYGKPPKGSQFKKGKSGNPSGRPKPSFNVRETLEHHLHRKVQVREGSKMRTMTMFEAMIMSIIAAASRGNLKAIDRILSIVDGPKSIADLMNGRKIFEWTPEQEEQFSAANILVDGWEEKAVSIDDVGDKPDEKSTL